MQILPKTRAIEHIAIDLRKLQLLNLIILTIIRLIDYAPEQSIAHTLILPEA
jgi:hypothetical protein